MPRDFLFRRRQQPGALSYYVVSSRPPQPVPDLFTIQTKPYQPQLAAGEWFRFELQANPTVSRKYGSAVNGTRRPSKRHDVLMDAKSSNRVQASPLAMESDPMVKAALMWLLQQGKKCGIEVQPETVLTNGYTQHRLVTKGRNIQFSSIDYCGIAQVTGPALLTTALLNGVGDARAFGCGLILVRRME
jgi:CRISPR system Cascade subunit CasE